MSEDDSCRLYNSNWEIKWTQNINKYLVSSISSRPVRPFWCWKIFVVEVADDDDTIVVVVVDDVVVVDNFVDNSVDVVGVAVCCCCCCCCR